VRRAETLSVEETLFGRVGWYAEMVIIVYRQEIRNCAFCVAVSAEFCRRNIFTSREKEEDLIVF